MTPVVRAWERFWFEPEETSTLALVRIAFGLVMLAWTLSLAGDAYDFFTADGVLASAPTGDHEVAIWGALDLLDSDLAVALVLTTMCVASVFLIVGAFSRVAPALLFIGILSLERRNPFVFNAGDGLLKLIALFMVFAPSGASLSIDRWRRAPTSFWQFPARAPWALRLMQVQLSVMYLAMVWAKLRGETWTDGSAVGYALGLGDLQRFELPAAVLSSPLAVSVLTYGTVMTEAALAVLVWNRRLRPWVLGAGVVLHVSIDLTLRVGFFSYAVLVLYLAFLPPASVRAAALSLKHLFHTKVPDSGFLEPRKEGRSRA